MIFNSLNFLLFFLAVYLLYVFLPHRGQNLLLLAASYTFYASWDWRFLSLLMISTGVDYVLALSIARSDDPRVRRRFLVASMCVSLGILGFFKYFNFFEENLAALLGQLGLNAAPLRLDIILPWGISFYTFQTMNYTIDVYRRHMAPSRNLFEFAVFVSFFPHLVAGPIMRANVLLPQVQNPRRIDLPQVQEGAWLFFWGLFKKVVVADNLAALADRLFADGGSADLGSLLLAVYAFAFQIYGDFSGYSDMARGISKFMGFDLVVNFRNPYFAVNPSDFWRRWHISLSTWLRDYLYIPLGGNRSGPRRTYVNLMLTMLLGGLWHGANWTFVVWGALHGAFLAVHRLLRGEGGAGAPLPLWQRVLCILGTFHLVCLGWLFFRAPTAAAAWTMLWNGLANPAFGPGSAGSFAVLACLCAPVLAVEVLQEKTKDLLAVWRLSLVPRAMLYAALLLMLLTLGNSGSRTFIYFQF